METNESKQGSVRTKSVKLTDVERSTGKVDVKKIDEVLKMGKAAVLLILDEDTHIVSVRGTMFDIVRLLAMAKSGDEDVKRMFEGADVFSKVAEAYDEKTKNN